uniref:tetratricopeptide repeat protein n=1 Tax=Novipirellula sp. TaxID=2795430 RepID=UPI003563E4FF
MKRCTSTYSKFRSWRGSVALATVLLGSSGAFAEDSRWIPTDDLQASQVSVPSLIDESAGSEPVNPSSSLAGDVDPVERELRLQRAIADSLHGDNQKAIDSLGDPASNDTAALYASAMWMMQNGHVDEGMQTLRTIASREDAPAETHKFLSIGHLHLDQPQASEAAAEVYLESHPDDAYAHYVHGLAILRQDDPVRAHDSLRQAGYDEDDVAQIQTVAMQVPVDVMQRRLTIGEPITGIQNRSRYDDGCDSLGGGQAQNKPYNVTVLFAGEYDSNVPLQPRFSGLGSDIDHEDYRFLMASFLDLQLMS